MQYIALIYIDPARAPQPGSSDFNMMLADYRAATTKMKADGVYVAGDALQGVETATSLRIKGGKVETMDGPFAETKERLGGYYLMDCADLDQALAYAALIPGAKHGTIEVRPIMELQK